MSERLDGGVSAFHEQRQVVGERGRIGRFDDGVPADRRTFRQWAEAHADELA